VEWVKPIDEVEAEFRRRGVFMLVNIHDKKLMFFGYKKNSVDINKMIDSLRGRSHEMTNFLIARAKGKGETT
jgi:hypothetical protein